jgi:hypothetical protein
VINEISTRPNRFPKPSRVAWLSIADGCDNKGNLIIDHALRKVLNVSRPGLTLSAFSPLNEEAISRVNDSMQLLVLPGSTLLDRNDYPALDALHRITCDKLAIGVAFCASNGKVDLSTARRVNLPIGSRDPFTHKRLKAAGMESHFVGCPTLFIGDAAKWRHKSGPLVISLGPGSQTPLRECVLACAEFGDVILLEHVPRLQPWFPLPPRIRRIEIKSAAQAIDVYSTAAAVLTGRIHGYLTCLSLGIPVTFFGSWYDSRFSLLEYLGARLADPKPDRILRRVDRMLSNNNLSTVCLEKAAQLRRKMTKYLRRFGIAEGLHKK